MEKVRIIFVLPPNCTNESQASDIMEQAFELCKANVGTATWVKESQMDTTDLSKTDFVIFQEFEGEVFESVKQSNCARILGPWCVSVCLMEGRSIPNFPWPIYNVAMSGCVVSCSHLPKPKKKLIKEKIELMGGCYTQDLLPTNTHLITDSVKSEKYLQAAEAGVKLMLFQWVESVWEASQTSNIHANEQQFNKFKCPPLHNLTISSTGLSDKRKRQELSEIVVKNGGILTGALNVHKTDILIVYGEAGAVSEKYKAARKNSNIYCVDINWVYDSIAKGYALPHHLYKIKTLTSTPTKGGINPDFSIMSAIGDCATGSRTTVSETMMCASPSLVVANPAQMKRKSSSDDLSVLIDGLDVKKAKSAGQYLDGCSVYLVGFELEQREKICKILKLSGATRYDDISDRLTHIIVGDASCPEVKVIRMRNLSSSLVSIKWLVESMKRQYPVDEETFLIPLHNYDKPEFSSPLGRKGLSLLRSNRTLTSQDMEVDIEEPAQETEEGNSIMEQYLKNSTKEDDGDAIIQLLQGGFDTKETTQSSQNSQTTLKDENSENCTDMSSQNVEFLQQKKFLVVDFSVEISTNIKGQIDSFGGVVLQKSYAGIPDYVISPIFRSQPLLQSALEVVNDLWLLESIEMGEEMPIAYYHRPQVLTGTKPLESYVITVSGYTPFERNFFKELIEALGGQYQDQFARVNSTRKNIRASTHLVSLEASGKKYMAALKWRLPVVNKDWLLECARTGTFVPEDRFLLDASQAPKRDSNNASYFPNVTTSSSIVTPSSSSVNKSQYSSTKKTPATPLNERQPLNIDKTPVRFYNGVVDSPAVCSQVTPVNKIMEEVRRKNLLGTPVTPEIPKIPWYDVDTPASPFGRAIKEHMSPKSKKELLRYINRIPDLRPPPQPARRLSTPLSEVKRRCWAKFLGEDETVKTENSAGTSSQTDVELPQIEMSTEEAVLDSKLCQLEEMVKSTTKSSARKVNSHLFQSSVEEVSHENEKRSQPFSVGWDYGCHDQDTPSKVQKSTARIFIISGVDGETRQNLVKRIECLGAQVSDLATYDPASTHLLCPKPARNEKTLSCMASGKWILHLSYIEKSEEAGKFLNEEDFEFGNPKSVKNIPRPDKDSEARMQAMYWWRKEIARRGYGAFNDMRAIVVANKRDSIIRVIEAGGGVVVEVEPPFGDNVHATHCLLEPRSVENLSAYNPLAQQGIYCLNTVYISDFLHRINLNIKESVLPHFTEFY